MSMDFDEIKQILDMMREHDIAEFELERDNVKLRLRKGAAGHWSVTPAPSHSALISFISFIASMMHSTWPLRTMSPTSANAFAPGSGAR